MLERLGDPALALAAYNAGPEAVILERSKRAARNITAIDTAVKLTQGVTGVRRLEVVLGPEQPLPAGLALAARDGPQRVEATGDGGEEPLLQDGQHLEHVCSRPRRNWRCASPLLAGRPGLGLTTPWN